jgi:hypothetical protein
MITQGGAGVHFEIHGTWSSRPFSSWTSEVHPFGVYLLSRIPLSARLVHICPSCAVQQSFIVFSLFLGIVGCLCL